MASQNPPTAIFKKPTQRPTTASSDQVTNYSSVPQNPSTIFKPPTHPASHVHLGANASASSTQHSTTASGHRQPTSTTLAAMPRTLAAACAASRANSHPRALMTPDEFDNTMQHHLHDIALAFTDVRNVLLDLRQRVDILLEKVRVQTQARQKMIAHLNERVDQAHSRG